MEGVHVDYNCNKQSRMKDKYVKTNFYDILSLFDIHFTFFFKVKRGDYPNK